MPTVGSLTMSFALSKAMKSLTAWLCKSIVPARSAVAVSRTGVCVWFDRIGHEVQEQKVDVLDLIEAFADRVLGDHARRVYDR